MTEMERWVARALERLSADEGSGKRLKLDDYYYALLGADGVVAHSLAARYLRELHRKRFSADRRAAELSARTEAMARQAERARERYQQLRRAAEMVEGERFDQTVRDYIAAQPPSWLLDVLDVAFTLPSGRRVTYGEATRSDHQEVIEMCARQSHHAVDRASCHRQAVELLDAHGASCLSEIDGVADESGQAS